VVSKRLPEFKRYVIGKDARAPNAHRFIGARELSEAALVYMDMQAAQTNGIQSEINLTPMIDVLLVLIIISMVVAPVRTKGLEAVAPRESTRNPVADESSVVLVIGADGGLRLNRKSVSFDEMTGLVRRVAPRPVFIRGDGGLDFQDVARVVDAVRGAGVEQIGLLSGEGGEDWQ
jgi:biopolymer transport protein TolR